MKDISHRYDINRPRLKHGQKYTKYKICLSMRKIFFKNATIWSMS